MSPHRLSKGYEPKWDIDMALGKKGEEKVLGMLDGINAGKIEVKTDARASETGNLFVEYECRGKPSGIETTKATAWVFVIDGGGIATIVDIDVLKFLYGKLKESSKYRRDMNRGSHPTRGVIIPLTKLHSLSILAKKALSEAKNG